MTIQELKNNPNYEIHHTASCRGYVSRKGEGIIKEYDGRFGKGYALVEPRWDSTRYVWITYYIEK